MCAWEGATLLSGAPLKCYNLCPVFTWLRVILLRCAKKWITNGPEKGIIGVRWASAIRRRMKFLLAFYPPYPPPPPHPPTPTPPADDNLCLTPSRQSEPFSLPAAETGKSTWNGEWKKWGRGEMGGGGGLILSPPFVCGGRGSLIVLLKCWSVIETFFLSLLVSKYNFWQ